MRLICPNCDAQYDVADDVIPEGGRDVQCSSCAHTWFQTDKPIVAGRAPEDIAETSEPAEVPAPVPPAAPKRRPLESSIADILREEAEREHDLPADGTKTAAKPAAAVPEGTRRRISELAETESGSRANLAASATGAVAANANLRTVPGIDEINASLRARAEENDTTGLTETEKDDVVKRRGFRRGFIIVLFLIAILITPYFFAAEIVEALPQAQPYMETYVATVDDLRVWLDVQVQKGQTMFNDMMAPDNAAAE